MLKLNEHDIFPIVENDIFCSHSSPFDRRNNRLAMEVTALHQSLLQGGLRFARLVWGLGKNCTQDFLEKLK